MSIPSKLLAGLALPTLVLALGAAAPQAAQAALVVQDFEGFADGTSLTAQIAGLSFANAQVLNAGLGLNELEFPPHSGVGAVVDDGGAIAIDFSGQVFSVGAYFTYTTALTFSVYDIGNALLGTRTSAFGSNLALSGEAGSLPNEFLSFSSASGSIARLVVTGDLIGGSFIMDDLTVDTGNAVPEPQTLALLAGMLAAGAVPGGWLRRRRPR